MNQGAGAQGGGSPHNLDGICRWISLMSGSHGLVALAIALGDASRVVNVVLNIVVKAAMPMIM